MGKAQLAMTPVQPWGEEAEEGAVYTILLQRVKAQEPQEGGDVGGASPQQGDANLQSCPFMHYHTRKRRMLRAGTLSALVRWLLASGAEGDLSYITSFLATYQVFATPKEVLELLLPLGPVKVVLRVLHLWLQDHPEDFWEPPEHPSLHRVLHFLHQFAPGTPACALAKSLLLVPKKEEEEACGGDVSEANGGKISGVGLPQVIPGAVEPGADKEFPALLSFAVEEVAEQLTRMDSDLFQAVRPFHCLGCVWSQRDKKEKQHVAPSVRATVAQFNAVTSCVIASVLEDLTLHVPQRAHLLEKWIEIAQHCRVLRNFSSLYAILSALQSNPIYRLKRTWSAVNRNTRITFQKLSQIFSEDNNHLNCREILLQDEGALGPRDGGSSPQMPAGTPLKRNAPSKKMLPTVPYLGTFLTDLIMLHTALPDFVEGNLINFEKRRKEAETLTLIRQLQESCRGYCLRLNPSFQAAFQGQQKLSEEQSRRISRVIEPPASSCPSSPKLHRSLTKRFSSLFLGLDPSATLCGPDRAGVPPPESFDSLHSGGGVDVSCNTAIGAPPQKACQLEVGRETPAVVPVKDLPACQTSPCPLLGPTLLSPTSKESGTESRIIRVSVDNGHGNLYRSIVITSQDKTATVVQRALQKHNLGAEASLLHNYQFLQRLGSGQELLIPSSANTFYAMSPTSPCDFLLRHKEEATESGS